jgi:flavin-dependent dehydrogenase
MMPASLQFYVGTARKILTLDELEAPAASFDAGSATKDTLKSMVMNDLRTSFRPAGTFAGYDLEEKSKGSLPAPAPVADAPKKSNASSKVNTGADGETIVGVAWLDDAGKEHVTTARLTIIADGMYSALRSKVHLNAPKTASHFCGYILHHPAGKTPLPYPNRGHVLMADPSPVLLYQISSTETRVLVDIAGRVPNVADGSLRKYFEDVIAPQMPPVVRPFFLKAVATQEPSIMPNRGLVTAPYQKKGVVLLGDSWNMRHPLTGGGMTVALQDTELFWSAIRHLDLQSKYTLMVCHVCT